LGARDRTNTLLEHVRDALDEAGDTDAVTELLDAVSLCGTTGRDC
jgi:hypothetical protein